MRILEFLNKLSGYPQINEGLFLKSQIQKINFLLNSKWQFQTLEWGFRRNL